MRRHQRSGKYGVCQTLQHSLQRLKGELPVSVMILEGYTFSVGRKREKQERGWGGGVQFGFEQGGHVFRRGIRQVLAIQDHQFHHELTRTRGRRRSSKEGGM
jgi:hypothetical protein